MKPQNTLKEDPHVKIPAAVKAAAARSEQLFHGLRDAPVQTSTELTPEDTPKDDPAPEKPDATPDPALTAESLASGVTPEGNKTVREPASETPPAGEETWEHKYRSEHGRNIVAQRQIRELSDQVTSLQNVIATMQATGASTPKAPAAPKELSFEDITPDEISDYGEDFLKVVGKQAQRVLKPVIERYEAEISRVTQQLDGMTAFVKQDAHTKLLSTLDKELPAWRQLNTNDNFIDWLGLPDPYSGAIRHDMLKAAYAQGDSRRVLAFFNGFLAEKAAVAPASTEPVLGTETVQKVPLESLAAPGRAKAAATPTVPAEKPFLNRAQIASFYADVAAGKYRGNEAEKDKLEKIIFEAQREGRIR